MSTTCFELGSSSSGMHHYKSCKWKGV